MASNTSMHEDVIEPVAEAFREYGYNAIVTEADLHISVELSKHGTQLDWTCYRIIDDNIYQWPVVKIPVSLHTDLKQIDFLGEQFNVPNPPGEYLRLKYGPEWTIPKRTGFEQDILNLMPDEEPSGGLGKIMQLMKRLLVQRSTGSLKVLDFDDRPVEGAEVDIASTTILSGLGHSRRAVVLWHEGEDQRGQHQKRRHQGSHDRNRDEEAEARD